MASAKRSEIRRLTLRETRDMYERFAKDLACQLDETKAEREHLAARVAVLENALRKIRPLVGHRSSVKAIVDAALAASEQEEK